MTKVANRIDQQGRSVWCSPFGHQLRKQFLVLSLVKFEAGLKLLLGIMNHPTATAAGGRSTRHATSTQPACLPLPVR